MALINISNLTFSYEGSYDTLFDNVSLQLDTEWRLGFVGRNGRGKTTLLRLLLGELEYGGNISAPCAFSYFPYPVADHAATAAKLAQELRPGHAGWELARELSLLDVDEEVLARPFSTLSGGERTKVLLAILFLGENNFLLIDEPTNHLDLAGRALVRDYLRGKKGFILVSHDRDFLDGCVDHILSLGRSGLEIQRGNYSSWLENKQRRDAFETQENERLKREIKHLTAAARRTADWSDTVEKTKYATKNSGLRPDRGAIGHKAAKMMKRSKAIEERREAAATEKSALLKDIENAEALKIMQLRHHARRLAELRDVSIFYGQTAACRGVNLTIEQGERVAVGGRNGAGKSSVLRLICGEPLAFTGSVERAANLLVSYVSQDTSGLRGSLAEYAGAHNIDESLFKAILRKLDFSRAQFDKPLEEFSGGQKKKVLIARSLCEPSHLLVWDEPLNYIDLLSRAQIEALLLQYKPTLLFVEHDRLFRERVATRAIEL